MPNGPAANPSAPAFEPGRWNDPSLDPAGSNCYQYALGGSEADGSNKLYNESIPNPGMLAGYYEQGNDFTNPTGMANRLMLDGLTVASTTQVPTAPPGYYVAGFYLSQPTADNRMGDFHWVRQDRDGGWSEKTGTNGIVQRVLEPAADGTYQPLPPTLRGYQLVGYVLVPERGIDLGIEQSMVRWLRDDPSAVQRYIDTMTMGDVNRIRDTLTRKYPESAPAFRDAIEAFYTDRTSRIAESLRSDPNNTYALDFFKRADPDKEREVTRRLVALDPALGGQVRTLEHRITIDIEANQAANILMGKERTTMANFFNHDDAGTIREIGEALKRIHPELSGRYELAALPFLRSDRQTAAAQPPQAAR